MKYKMMKHNLFAVGLLMLSSLACANSTPAKMISVSGGNLDPKLVPNLPAQQLTVKPFMISALQLTRTEWDEYLKATGQNNYMKETIADGIRIAGFMADPDSAVAGITFLEAVQYCNWRSSKENLEPVYQIEGRIPTKEDYPKILPNIVRNQKANGYRLPTAAEWTYAALGGEKGIQSHWWEKTDPKDYGWFSERTHNSSSHSVGKWKPNPIGLYDLVGNTSDWSEDERSYEGRDDKMHTGGRVVLGSNLNFSDVDIKKYGFFWFLTLSSGVDPFDRQYIGIRLARNLE